MSDRDPFAGLSYEHGECWASGENGVVLRLAHVDSPAIIGRSGVRGPGGSRYWFSADVDWTLRPARLTFGSRVGELVWVASDSDCQHKDGVDILENYGLWLGELMCHSCFGHVLDDTGYPSDEIIAYCKSTRETCGMFWGPEWHEWLDSYPDPPEAA